LPPPRFTYVPGPPGRSVGVRAIVEVDGTSLVSEPLELELRAVAPNEMMQRSPQTQRAPVDSSLGLPFQRLTQSASPSGKTNLAAGSYQAKRQSIQGCHVPGEVVSEIFSVNGTVGY